MSEEGYPFEQRTALVRQRRGPGWQLKPEAEELDGQTITVTRGWVMSEEDTSIYVGETAWIVPEEIARFHHIGWVASGDLEFVP